MAALTGIRSRPYHSAFPASSFPRSRAARALSIPWPLAVVQIRQACDCSDVDQGLKSGWRQRRVRSCRHLTGIEEGRARAAAVSRMLRLARELKHQSISRRDDSSEEDELHVERRRSARLNLMQEQVRSKSPIDGCVARKGHAHHDARISPNYLRTLPCPLASRQAVASPGACLRRRQ